MPINFKFNNFLGIDIVLIIFASNRCEGRAPNFDVHAGVFLMTKTETKIQKTMTKIKIDIKIKI